MSLGQRWLDAVLERGDQLIARAFDWHHGTDIRGDIEPVTLHRDTHPQARFLEGYEGIGAWAFRSALRAARLPDAQELTFIDLGAGKGYAMMLAAQRTFRRLIGVELSPELHRISRANLRQFTRSEGGAERFELHCLPAEAFTFPPEDSLVFMFNPFLGPVMRAVLARLRASLEEAPRRVWVLYYNPVCAGVFEEEPLFRPVLVHRRFRLYHCGDRERAQLPLEGNALRRAARPPSSGERRCGSSTR